VVKVLYGAPLALGGTAEHRLRAFRRIVPDVAAFDTRGPENLGALGRFAERFPSGLTAGALNASLLAAAEAARPDLVWLDKPILVLPRTVRALRAMGAQVVSYMPDDPFGPRRDGIWRLFAAALPEYSAHVVPREVTRQEFEARGARRALTTVFAFEPTVHYPPWEAGQAPQKRFDISFVGYPHDQRARWIADLVRQAPGIRIGVFGPGWDRHAAELVELGVEPHPGVFNDAYREVIWSSRLSLSFITRSNRDEMSHKAIEAAAAGTPPLVEPSPVHSRVFEHGTSAFFFETPDQLAGVVQDALARGEALDAVGRGAAEAVRRAEMSNDDVVRGALNEVECNGEPSVAQLPTGRIA
jgi:hypothetical protein